MKTAYTLKQTSVTEPASDVMNFTAAPTVANETVVETRYSPSSKAKVVVPKNRTYQGKSTGYMGVTYAELENHELENIVQRDVTASRAPQVT